ncbi:SDR family NAD(P)-dependent oxidoreductase [Algibacillus agarilyticus]|uniref:SDR family NAD(P)-dependent oxidoreductase n=1 Tax=Algibacillus agarilyticus TaxID=2234133 RepID=UPI000DCF826E|nr:SDR family NAD(P)-dependent oxidoreductase [Algibacillus agarilyticus]
MNKTILITGSTDGIGLATAKSLVKLGHTVLLHGRSEAKLADAKTQLLALVKTEAKTGTNPDKPELVFTYQADLSSLTETKALAEKIKAEHNKLDTLINNAGVFIVPATITPDDFDVRFMVNTIAPYLLTQALLPLLGDNARVINLSSAAQAPLSAQELLKPSTLSDSAVHAKSKLALTMWSRQLALTLGKKGPVVVAINPKSFLGSKMVEQAYGVTGSDVQLGADILVRAALSEEFSSATGLYFDNDIGKFSSPHPDALNPEKIAELTQVLEQVINKVTSDN